MGRVPTHWEILSLGQVGTLTKGTGGNKEDELPTGMPCVRYGDLYTTHKYFVENARSFIAPEVADQYTKIKFGDVLFAASGETADEIGKSAVNLLRGPAYCGGDVILFRPHGHLIPRYTGYMMDCEPIVHQKATMGRGFTVYHIYGKQLKYLRIPIPPPEEQAAIARFLDHADEQIQRYIASKERLITLLEEERKVATEQALRTQRAENLRLQNVANLMRRPIGRNDATTYTPVGLFNRGRGMFLKEPTAGRDLGDSDFYWIQKGDLVISGQFAWEGAIAVAGENDEGCVASHRYPILLGKDGVLETQFLFSFLQTDWGQTLLDLHSRGAAGRNRPLNAGYLLKEKIPVPPIDEQISVVTLLEREREMRENLAQTRVLMNEYRTRLIADVVTGQLDVREAAAQHIR